MQAAQQKSKREELLELLGISVADYQKDPLVHAVVTHLEVGTSPAYLLGKMLAQLAGVKHYPSSSSYVIPLNAHGLDELIANGKSFETVPEHRIIRQQQEVLARFHQPLPTNEDLALYQHEHPCSSPRRGH